MFHATAAGSFAKVENEGVAFEWSSAHKLLLVLANALQVRLDLLFPPIVPMNHHPNIRPNSRQLKLFELPCLAGRVDKGIVARGITTEDSDAAVIFDESNRGTGCYPISGNLRHRKMHGLAPPLWHVHEDHRRIDEGMLRIELRGKGAHFIPVRGVRQFDRARALDSPRLLVHFLDECFLR